MARDNEEQIPAHEHGVAEVLQPEGDQSAPAGAERIELPWADHVDDNWDAFDFTQCERFVEIGGRKLNYVDLGDKDKPVLLFVHGIMGTWRNWIFNLLPFADRYRVIAVDLPGFGLSEMPKDPLTMQVYSDTVAELIRTLGLQNVTLVGNSMGGLVGTIFAKQNPELLEKLVLVDAAGFSTSNKKTQRASRFIPLFAPLLALGYVLRTLIARSRVLSTIFTKIVLWRPMNIPSELILVLLSGLGKPAFVPAAQSIFSTPVSRIPGEVTTETLIIWGRNDSLIPKRDAFKFARMIPHADLRLIPDTGHIPMFETPDQFNAIIDEFAAKQPASSSLASEAA